MLFCHFSKLLSLIQRTCALFDGFSRFFIGFPAFQFFHLLSSQFFWTNTKFSSYEPFCVEIKFFNVFAVCKKFSKFKIHFGETRETWIQRQILFCWGTTFPFVLQHPKLPRWKSSIRINFNCFPTLGYRLQHKKHTKGWQGMHVWFLMKPFLYEKSH